MTAKALSLMALAACVATVAAPVAHADRAEPVPIYGFYNAYLDHSRQTFNGQPEPSDPSTQLGQFTTNCDAKGCLAHWLRLTAITENPNAPSLFDYTWNNDRWESSGEYPFNCNAGGKVTAFRSDFLAPSPNGGFAGERTFVVGAPGCPGEGAGTYWLPISLTPTDAPSPSAQ